MVLVFNALVAEKQNWKVTENSAIEKIAILVYFKKTKTYKNNFENFSFNEAKFLLLYHITLAKLEWIRKVEGQKIGQKRDINLLWSTL